MATFVTNYRCFDCRAPFASRQSLQKILCKDDKQHFVCSKCCDKQTETKIQEPEVVMVMQCSCGNVSASHMMVDGLCIPCQRAKKNAAPFAPDDVIKFIPMYAQEFVSKGKTHALVLNCLNYGSEKTPNWAVDVQFLKEQDGILRLTPVKAYMVASWQIEKSNRDWER